MSIAEAKIKRAIQSCRNKIEHHYEHTHHKRSKAIENEHTKIQALKKQLPKNCISKVTNKGIDISGEYDIESLFLCPECCAVVGDCDLNELYGQYCHSCGQKLSIPESEDEK